MPRSMEAVLRHKRYCVGDKYKLLTREIDQKKGSQTMGKKLAEVKKKSSEGGESFRKGAEQGRKAVSDVKSMKQLLDSLPADVDDEIAEAARAVQEGAKSDAKAHMDSAVHASVERGNDRMKESSEAARQQVDSNKDVNRLFAKMDEIGSFGRSARSEGRGVVEQSIREFQQAIQENEQAVQEASQEYTRQVNEIDSTL